MPEGRIIALDDDTGDGVIRPLRRQPDTHFTTAAVAQDDMPAVRLGDWVTYVLTDSPPGQPRRAAEVRHTSQPAPEVAMQDPAWSETWANIERDHEEFRMAVERRYKRGEMTIYQRAGLLADAEYARATHLIRIVRMHGGGHNATLERGTIYTINPRGYAFLRTTTGEHLFVHASRLVGVPFEGLRPGDIMTYRRIRDPRGKGYIAMNVEPIKRAPAPATTACTVPAPDEPTPGRWRVPAVSRVDEWAGDDTAADWGAAS